MELYINETNIDVTLEDEKTIGDVLREIEINNAQNNATTVAIKLNGDEVNADNYDEIAIKPIENDTKIEIRVISQNEIETALKLKAKDCDKLTSDLANISVELQNGNLKAANSVIINLADFIDDLCHLTTLTALFPERFTSITIDNKSVSEFFKDLSSILSDFKDAIEQQDSVTIGDLSEYEISPRLQAISKAIKEI